MLEGGDPGSRAFALILCPHTGAFRWCPHPGIAHTEILQFTYQDLCLLSKLLGTKNVFGLSFVLYVLKLSSRGNLPTFFKKMLMPRG